MGLMNLPKYDENNRSIATFVDNQREQQTRDQDTSQLG